jgi:hypothetical protein
MLRLLQRVRRAVGSLGTSAVTGEAHALVSGTYLAQVLRHGGEAAPWMALNAAAHGSLLQLQQFDLPSRRTASSGDHEIARAAHLVVDELLQAVGSDEEMLAMLQRMLLLPLELDLLAASGDVRVSVDAVVRAARALLGVRHR